MIRLITENQIQEICARRGEVVRLLLEEGSKEQVLQVVDGDNVVHDEELHYDASESTVLELELV
jgi:hypothetical protein